MIRSEYPKKFRTCWAIDRASSSFMPARSIEFLIARVRSSTVRAPRGPGSVLVRIAIRGPLRASNVPGELLIPSVITPVDDFQFGVRTAGRHKGRPAYVGPNEVGAGPWPMKGTTGLPR